MSTDEALGAMFINDVRQITIGGGWNVGQDAAVTLELRAASADAAESYAQLLVKQVRAAAKLDAGASLAVIWVAPLAETEPSSHRFLSQAQELFDSEHFELAVVSAQIHFERQLLTLLENAVEKDSPRWAKRLIKERGATQLKHRVSQATVQLLLGVDVTQLQPLWEPFLRHLDLRNQIVHAGAAATEEQARESIDVVIAFWVKLADAARQHGHATA